MTNTGTNANAVTPAPRGWLTPEQARAALVSGRGAGIRVAVLDSGVETNHPDLPDMIVRESIAIIEENGRLLVRENDSAGDVYGHGTAVASLIHRIAPEAEIGSFRVLDARSLSRTAVICQGIREAIRRGYHIINCSFGCKGLAKYLLPHKEWADTAYVRGVHVVAACNNFDLFEPEWPAHFSSVISVNMSRAGTNGDSDGDGNADAGGPGFFHRPGALVEFAAPGENIDVAWQNGTRKTETGSSFAAPQVAGYVARLLSEAPGHTLPPAHVLDLLPRIARPWQDNMACE